MKEQEKLEEFSRFEALHRKALWDQVLRPRKEAEGNPNWRPQPGEVIALAATAK
jgi:hypothetical protein